MTCSKYIADINALLAGSAHDRFAGSLYINVAATAYVLGVNVQQVRKLMQGYPRTKIGRDVRYLKSDVYEALKKKEVLTA